MKNVKKQIKRKLVNKIEKELNDKRIDSVETAVKNMLPKVASVVGRSVGNLIGQPDNGAKIGRSMAKLFGHGDYKISSNSLFGGKSNNPLPEFSTKRGTRIVEREYIGDILAGTVSGGSTVFDNYLLPISPTSRSTFPWLSTIAQLYDQWEPHGIVFEFISTSSEYNGISQALGTVIMATEYDVDDPIYASKQEMENSDYACSTKPSLSLMHGIECAASERPTKLLYTSSANGFKNTFNTLGNFQIATTGCNTTGVRLGELWVSYDVTFYKKQLLSPTVGVYYISAKGTSAVGTTFLANPTINSLNGDFGIVSVSSSIVAIRFPRSVQSGRFRFSYEISNVDVGDNLVLTYNRLSVVSGYAANTVGQAGHREYLLEVTQGAGTMDILISNLKFVSTQNWILEVSEVASNYVFN